MSYFLPYPGVRFVQVLALISCANDFDYHIDLSLSWDFEQRMLTISQSLSSSSPLVLEKDVHGCWQVRGYEEARFLLNSHTTQAGFGTEQMVRQRRFTPPIPAIDGDEHRERRSQVAKFFTPLAATNRYKDLMSVYADQIIESFQPGTTIDFKNLSTQMASAVVCEVVGLTNSIRSGLEDRFLYVASHHDVGSLSPRPKDLYNMFSTARTLLEFWLFDIRPAIQARKQTTKNDLISHMMSKNLNGLSIMIECITYGLAGVLTTREFMCSALELCLQEPEYRDLILQDNQELRTRFLYEVLRLNPVTSHLTRRAAEDIQITSNGQTFTIRQGELIVFNIFEIDTDSRALGADALLLRLDRSYESRIMWSMLVFGAGPHRCPGEALAILETDILLSQLHALDIEALQSPTRGFNEPSKTNELHNFMIHRN